MPGQLKTTASVILQAQFFGAPIFGNVGVGPAPNYAMTGATDNINKSMTDLMVWSDLQGATLSASDWYMWETKRPVKPLTWLLRQAPDFTYRVSPQDPIVFDQHAYLSGSVARGAPAWGLPFLGSRSGVSA